ncbi:MAG: hypothetical protein IPF50_11830 [Proteobacteria bacterium]|nr:hypothetical protein [Pseudomonadota bacterium]MBP7611188.1 hypothetical protein [Steroidobacteraceae bacterium]
MMASGSEQLPVLVFGTTVTALGAVRTFARLGHAVWTHTEPGDVVTLSRYYRPMPLPAAFDPKAPTAARLESILRALPTPKAFLLPCSDFWTEAATELPDDLKARFPACLSPREAIYTLTDKGRLAATMESLGLPHPRSFAIEREDDLAAIDDRVFESAFLKPKSSPLFLQVFKAKGLHVHSRAEALASFREVKAAGFEVILQEYIPGPPTGHFFIDGFMDRQHVVQARFARQRLRMYPPDFGNSTYMASVPVATVQPAMDALETLLRHLRYRGIFSAEYKRDPRDGTFHLIEVNARPWWYVGYAEHCRVPVCEMAYADALGLPLGQQPPYPIGARCVYPQFDAQEYRWRRSQGLQHASLLTYAGAWLTAHKPVFAWDDPWPAVSGALTQLGQSLRKRLGRA